MHGDDMLSAFDRRMWSLVYACLYKFGCPVMFKLSGPAAQHRIDLWVIFFVPSSCEKSHLVIDFLHEELDGDIRAGVDLKDCYVYGTQVSIMEFSGVDFYIEKDVIASMSHQFLESLMKKIQNRKEN